jgi:hypothetical protein
MRALALWGISPGLQAGAITTQAAEISESQRSTEATVSGEQNGYSTSGATAINAKCAAVA